MGRDVPSDADRVVDVLGVIANALEKLVGEVSLLRQALPGDSSQPKVGDLLALMIDGRWTLGTIVENIDHAWSVRPFPPYLGVWTVFKANRSEWKAVRK